MPVTPYSPASKLSPILREDEILRTVSHRPSPLPGRRWVMQQRWNDLLFAHWPVPAEDVERTLPPGLVVDTFDGWAWLGVVPFAMDRIRLRGMPSIPGTRAFPELNLRTYVRERGTNRSGVFFYSLDASNPLAVAVARMAFRLPYFWAQMKLKHDERDGCTPEIHYWSQRLFSRKPVHFEAKYKGLGKAADGALEQFLTARYALYTAGADARLLRGDIHHLPWPLEHAEAEFVRNELPGTYGFTLPDRAPVLHYARELVVYIWSLEPLARWATAHSQAQPAASPVSLVDQQV